MESTSVQVDGLGGFAAGLVLYGAQASSLEGVTVTVVNAARGQGIRIGGAAPTLSGVTVDIACTEVCSGVETTSGVTILNSQIVSSSYAVSSVYQPTAIVGSKIVGGTHAVYLYDSSVRISFSEVRGPFEIVPPATVSCFGVHDESLSPVACP